MQTNLTQLGPTQFTFTLSLPINHLVVFLLPGTVLPPGTAASVYIQLPNKPFDFLGAIANEKPSAIFRVKGLGAGEDNAGGMDDMVDEGGAGMIPGEVVLGISVEEVAVVEANMARLKAGHADGSNNSASMQLAKRIDPKVLAMKVIQNAYDYLSSFAENRGGEEVVPLKRFMDWWKKFESRANKEEGFLERATF